MELMPLPIPSPIPATSVSYTRNGRARRAYHVGVAGVLRERHPATDAALVRVVEQQGLQLLLQLLEPRHREARHHSRRRTPANGSGSGSHTGQRQPPKGRESSTAGSEEEGEGHERLEIGRTCGSGSGSGDGGLGSEGSGGALVGLRAWLLPLLDRSGRGRGGSRWTPGSEAIIYQRLRL